MIGKSICTLISLALLQMSNHIPLTMCELEAPYTTVAAIDFGTTFSGYGYSTIDNPYDIKMNNNWGAEIGFEAYKTSTSVLVNSDNEMVAFGFQAENICTGFTEVDDDTADIDGGDKEYHLYRQFKMLLFQNEELSRSTTITSVDGKVTSAMSIFVKALEYLKKHMLHYQAKWTNGTVDESLIKWVVTVPAIWREKAKLFMRESAYHAGLTKSIDSSQLTIALEPEAASMYCRSVNVNHFVGGVNSGASFQVGTKYMVIDAGGGTIDLTAHEILDSRKVKEIYKANGGGWGGTQIDANFISLLEKLLGSQCVNSYKTANPQTWMTFMINFEKSKRVAKLDGKFIAINIPYAMSMYHFEELCGKSFEKLVKESGLQGVRFRTGMLELKQEAVVSIYQPVIDKIIQHIAELIEASEAVKSIKYYFLVGGFAESEFLQQAIKNKFEPRVKVLIPPGAQLSVIKGAVLFGYNEGAVTSRIMDKTIGTAVSPLFDSAIHPHQYKVNIDGFDHCSGVFDVFVQIDEEVPLGHVLRRQYSPVSTKATQVNIFIYATDRKDVKHVSEAEVQELGSFILETPITGHHRTIHVDVIFGGTEIKVHAKDESSGLEGNIVIDFLSDVL